MLDVGGKKGYFEPGFMPELWIFAVQAYNDPGGNGPPAKNYNRGIGHHLNVPWPTACAALGIARSCTTVGAARVAELTGQSFCGGAVAEVADVAEVAAPRSVLSEACNLNGRLVQADHGGRCVCLPAWRGASCGELALLPAHAGAGLHAGSNMSSWGGAVAFDAPSGRWVMFGNELVGGCGINSWESNSRIVRASTADLDTAFVVDAVVLPSFASEPSLAKLGEQWLLYSIGNASSSKPPRTDCVEGYSPSGAPPPGTGGNFVGFVPVSVSTAATLTGEWTLQSTFGNGDFNPSPLVFPNGTTLLMWRHLARVHMVRADDIGGPFAFNGSDSGCPVGAGDSSPGCRWWHLFPPTADQNGLEDPFIYAQPDPSGSDSTAVTYHALFHDHKHFGGHGYSRDAISWTFSDVAPYSNNVTFTDGSTISMQRRERPHLVFDDRGMITHLTNGVQPPPTAAKSPPTSGVKLQNDYVYTLLQPVQT